MFQWLWARLSEPSTKVAIGAAALAVQQLLQNPPANAAQWLGWAVTFLGLSSGAATAEKGMPGQAGPTGATGPAGPPGK